MTHWAARYIGRPHSPAGEGPDAFSCWGLIRHVFSRERGVDFPAVQVGDEIRGEPVNVQAIKASARASGFRRLEQSVAPADGDIVIMRSAIRLHCGLVLRVNGGIRVLHSSHERGVVLEHWRDAVAGMSVELWGHREN